MENKENKFIRKTFEPKISKTQQTDIQNLINICSQKLDKDPSHKKALIIRASSYIKKNEFDRVFYFNLGAH